MRHARIPKWTPPIDGWHYRIGRTNIGLAFVDGPNFRIVKLRTRWRVKYTTPYGDSLTGWDRDLGRICKGLTAWLVQDGGS